MENLRSNLFLWGGGELFLLSFLWSQGGITQKRLLLIVRTLGPIFIMLNIFSFSTTEVLRGQGGYKVLHWGRKMVRYHHQQHHFQILKKNRLKFIVQVGSWGFQQDMEQLHRVASYKHFVIFVFEGKMWKSLYLDHRCRTNLTIFVITCWSVAWRTCPTTPASTSTSTSLASSSPPPSSSSPLPFSPSSQG